MFLQIFIDKIFPPVDAETHEQADVKTSCGSGQHGHFISAVITVVITENFFRAEYVIHAEADAGEFLILPSWEHGKEISKTQVHLIVQIRCSLVGNQGFS